ncbi:unnamed protein product [Mytilus edulis]|uniref:YqaJ viral recombinase domain-containing protein n=1 Tax=Mytilus edulis TaxID=6550 RepID=A0A8S3T9F2_MYTED|nr:unnamed protein product [Mytilus edulis]
MKDESSQTAILDTDLYSLLQDAASVLKERGRYDDFLTVLRCIADRTLIDNISLHLLLDVGNFYATNCIQGLRYSEETITFWVTVKKLFKGKGVNFFRGFKAQGLEKDKECISPKDCRINFAVPSNPTLASESTKYTVGLENPGILETSLDAFAEKNVNKDIKISIDGKKLALGFGKTGDENLGGFENSPTLKDRQERLANEQKTARNTTELFEKEDLDRPMAKQGLLLTISNMSKRIQELREFNVKRKRHVENLLKSVDGNWQQSKFAHAISYWQTKLVQANNCVSELIDCMDKLGYAVSCLNGTSNNYIQGSKSTIFLNRQGNYKCLKDGIHLNEPMDQDSNIMKQRSNAWHELRNGSRITGSTIFRALGLDTLKEQQNHYDKVYKGVEKPISDNLSSLFEYGTAQEINALGSFVGKVMPVYFPDLIYKEDGCIILPFGDTQAVISGDGTGVNTNNDVVAFEFKCPMPGKKYKTDALYEIPVYYTTQVLSQMAAKNLQELAFICYTPDSITYIRGHFDAQLWSRIWTFVEKCYGSKDAARPTRRDPEIQTLLADLKAYSKQCEFIAEFPSLRSVPCECLPTSNASDMYGNHVDLEHLSDMSFEDVPSFIQKSMEATNTAYNILRKPAKEVLVTVISDLDRQSRGDDSVVHAVPIHYGLSGFSLSMSSVRKLLHQVVCAIHARRLNTKAIAFDGQFLEIAIADDNGKALTVSKFTKQFWEDVKSTDKKVKRETLMKLNDMPNIKNMEDLFAKIQQVGSPENISKIFYKKQEKIVDEDEIEESIPSQDGDILQYLPTEIISALDAEAIEIIKSLGNIDTSDLQDKTEDQNQESEDINLQDDDYEKALIAMLVQADGKSKFDVYSLQKFKELFTDAKTINTSFTAPEMKILINLLDKAKYKKSALKPELVNIVSKWYGNGDSLEKTAKSPLNLKKMVQNHIKRWPIDAINVAYAQLKFRESFDVWCDSNPFNGPWNIKTDKGTLFTISTWYAQPALVDGKWIQPIIDPHHIFVNNRSRCCSKGMSGMGINPSSWWKVAEDSVNNKAGLSIEVAKELRDRQKHSFAQATFSEKVEKVMEINGDVREANWCSLIRNWYSAIDDAGISVDTRLQKMLDIRSYLLPFLRTGHFPPQGAYIAGLPIAQFEGILSNVDRRIQLYSMTTLQTYNQRAITSLDSETFFSGFQDYDPKGTGVLRADDIPTALGAAVYLYKQRLDPNRKFYMRTSERVRVYQVQPLDDEMNFQQTGDKDATEDATLPRTIFLRSHQFDTEKRKTKVPKRKSGKISDIGQTARGAEGARSFHKFNEEKILAHRRSGIMDDKLFDI